MIRIYVSVYYSVVFFVLLIIEGKGNCVIDLTSLYAIGELMSIMIFLRMLQQLAKTTTYFESCVAPGPIDREHRFGSEKMYDLFLQFHLIRCDL